MKPKDPLQQLFDQHEPQTPSPAGEWDQIQQRIQKRQWQPWTRVLAASAMAAGLFFVLTLPPSPTPADPTVGIDTQAYFEDRSPIEGEEYLALLQSL